MYSCLHKQVSVPVSAYLLYHAKLSSRWWGSKILLFCGPSTASHVIQQSQARQQHTLCTPSSDNTFIFICEAPRYKELRRCLSSSTSAKGTAGKKKTRPVSGLGRNLFQCNRYFTSIDCPTPTVPTAGKDDVSFRASFLLKAMSQDVEGRGEDGLFSLQLKVHPAERQTLCLRGWFSPRRLLLRREGPAAGSRAACWPPVAV